MEVIRNIPRLPLPQLEHKPSRSFKLRGKFREEEVYLENLTKRAYQHPMSARVGGDQRTNKNETKTFLSRTLSIPFTHSWEYNNIDASSLVCTFLKHEI